jgi:cytoplasmic tRNA 2-thiolation protein 1
MAALVPPEVSSSVSCGAHAEETNGCGTRNSDGGSMAQMERQMLVNEAAAEREIEVTLPNGAGATQKATRSVSIHDKKARGRKKVNKQVMGQCERCGYLSSQKICKACSLLEGLNKSRPRNTIEVGIEEEEGSTTLMRQVTDLTISAG